MGKWGPHDGKTGTPSNAENSGRGVSRDISEQSSDNDSRGILLEPLEPRILLSADPATLNAAAAANIVVQLEENIADQSVQQFLTARDGDNADNATNLLDQIELDRATSDLNIEIAGISDADKLTIIQPNLFDDVVGDISVKKEAAAAEGEAAEAQGSLDQNDPNVRFGGDIDTVNIVLGDLDSEAAEVEIDGVVYVFDDDRLIEIASPLEQLNISSILPTQFSVTVTGTGEAQLTAQTDSGIFSVRIAAELSLLHIQGSEGDDSFTLDQNLGSLIENTVIAGGDGADSVTLLGNAATDWKLTASGTGGVSGALSVTYSGVEELVGGSGEDTLHGPAEDTDWRVTGYGSGNVAGTNFSGFENLQGAADNQDHFLVDEGGDIDGLMHGGNGGFDILTITGGTYNLSEYIATGPDSGFINLDNISHAFAGLEPTTDNTVAGKRVIDLTGADDEAVLQNAAAGFMTLDSINGTFEDLTFANPTDSLTIRLGGGSDVITVASLDSNFAANLIIVDGKPSSGDLNPAGDNFISNLEKLADGDDKIIVDTDIILPGRNVVFAGETITVQNNRTVNTGGGSSGKAGAITLVGRDIDVNSGASFRASGIATDGDITLRAVDISERVIQSPFAITSKSATIDITNAAITGGKVSITAEAKDGRIDLADPTVSAIPDSAADARKFFGGVGNKFLSLLDEVPGQLTSALTGLALSVGVRKSEALVTIIDTDITSSDKVDIKATSETTSKLEAVSIGKQSTVAGGEQVSIAVGLGLATGVARTQLLGDTSIVAKKDVTVEADGTAKAEVVAKAVSNQITANQNASGDAVSVAVAIGATELTAFTKVGANASIASNEGAVIVNSTGSTKSSADAQTLALLKGRAGVTLSLALDFADVDTIVDGDLAGTGQQQAPATIDAEDAASVDIVGDKIKIVDHGFKNGASFTYKTGDTDDAVTPSAIGGLVDGEEYTIIVVDKDHIKLAREAVLDLEPTTNNATVSQSLERATTINFALNAFDGSSLRIPQHDFSSGDVVTYELVKGSGPIVGLTDGQQYTIETSDDEFFRLKNSSGFLIPISQGTDYGLHRFTRMSDGAVKEINLGRVDTGTDTFFIFDHGLANGTVVSYNNYSSVNTELLPGMERNPVNNNAQAIEYIVDHIDGNRFKLKQRDTQTGVTTVTPVDITGLPMFRDEHSFTYVDKRVEFAPTEFDLGSDVKGTDTGVIGSRDEIVFAAPHGLSTGDLVFYLNDQSFTEDVIVPIFDGSSNPLMITVTRSDPPIGELNVGEQYYVIVVDAHTIRLVEGLESVQAAAPIDLTGLGTGDSHNFTKQELVDGIAVTASLSAESKTKSRPKVGKTFEPTAYRAIFDDSTLITTGFIQAFSPTSAVPSLGKDRSLGSGQQGPQKLNQSLVQNSISTDSSTGAAGLSISISDHDVRAIVGEDANSMPVLNSETDILVDASIKQKTKMDAKTDVGQPKTSRGSSVAIAMSVNVIRNDANAIVGGTAALNARNDITVNSDVKYPIISSLKDIFVPKEFLDELTTKGISALNSRLDGVAGLTSLLNTNVYAGADSTKGNAYAGSIGVNVFLNSSNARIRSGAQLNQNNTFNTDGQTVNVTATTDQTLINNTGQLKLSLNDSAAGKVASRSKLFSDLKRTDFVKETGTAGQGGIGGSVLVDVNENRTTALIESDVNIHTGIDGALNVKAVEDILRISFVSSGTESKSSDGAAFAGSGLGLRQRSTTLAGLISDANGGVTVTGGGDLAIAAENNFLNVGVAGSIVEQKGSGFGVGVGVNDVDRVAAAFIGAEYDEDNNPRGTDAAIPAGKASLEIGDLSITADNSGTMVSVAVAGTFSQAEEIKSDKDDPLDGQSLPNLFGEQGNNVKASSSNSTQGAGGIAINFISDTTLAYINDGGSYKLGEIVNGVPSAKGNAKIAVTNDSNYVAVQGGLALTTKANATDKSTSIAGAFGLNQISAATIAAVKGASIDSNALDFNNQTEFEVSAERSGLLVSVAAAVSADLGKQSKAFSLSVAINRIVDVTEALIIDTGTINIIGDMVVTATNTAEIISVGGAVSVATGSASLGGALGYNQIANQTRASIIGTSQNTPLISTGGALDVEASNNNAIRAVGVSAGAQTGRSQNGTAGAFTVGINVISTDQSIFSDTSAVPRNPHIIEASIVGAEVIAREDIRVDARDDSVIQSIGGAFGVGLKSNAFGVSLGWNQVAITTLARLEDASVTSTQGNIIVASRSTETDGVIDGKISSAAIGGAFGSGKISIGASLSINGIINNVRARAINSSVTATAGSLTVSAEDDSTIKALTGGVGISTQGSGVGAAIGANFIANTLEAKIDGSTVTAGRDVNVKADEDASIEAITFGLAGASKAAVGGSVSVNVITNTVEAGIDESGANQTNVTANGNVQVRSTNNANMQTIAGGIAISGKAGVGASVISNVIVNRNDAYIAGGAEVTANANPGTSAIQDLKGKSRRGVFVEALSNQDILAVGVGGAAAGKAAIAGAATVSVVDDRTRAFVNGGTVTSAEDVVVLASSELDLIGIAGSLAIAGNVAVGVGADVGVATRRAEAFIGGGNEATIVTSNGSVVVDATGNERIVSVSAAGAVSASKVAVAVGVTAGIEVLKITNKAYIGNNATVTANDTVVVNAEGKTKTDLVAGSLAVAVGIGAGVGVAAGVGVVDKTTEAYIADGANVTGLALAGLDGEFVNTGKFSTIANSSLDDSGNKPEPREFVTSTVSGNTIQTIDPQNTTNPQDHGYETGQEVIYLADSAAIKGLQNGGRYFIIKIDDQNFQLASSRQNAQIGNAIALDTSGLTLTDAHQIQPLADVGIPTIGGQVGGQNGTANSGTSQSSFDANLMNSDTSIADKERRQGVFVTAVSQNDIETYGIAAAAGFVGVAVAGSVNVHDINTFARIDRGAAVNENNTDPRTDNDQSVGVFAARDYRNVVVGAGGALGGGGFAAGGSVPVLTGTTQAQIGGGASTGDTPVNARNNVEVNAQAKERMIGIAAGLAGGGSFALSASAAVMVAKTNTIAEITGEAAVAAGGNVLVLAQDDTDIINVGGSAGISIGGGGVAVGVGIVFLEKDTQAKIAGGAKVDANARGADVIDVMTGDLTGSVGDTDRDFQTGSSQGVIVDARSSEDVISIAASLGASADIGVAGSVAVNIIDSDTLATIDGGAQINQKAGAGADSDQSVNVSARNRFDHLMITGALSGGAVGFGAGVTVGTVRNDTQAIIGPSSVRAQQDIDVNAVALTTVDSNAFAAAVGTGGAGLAGGVLVYTIGGNYSDSYTISQDEGTDSGTSKTRTESGTKLKESETSSNQDILADVVQGVAALTSNFEGEEGPLPPITDVNLSENSFQLTNSNDETGSYGLRTGDAVLYNSTTSEIGGLNDGQYYYAIVKDAVDTNQDGDIDDNDDIPVRIELAATREDALAGNEIDLVNTGDGTLTSGIPAFSATDTNHVANNQFNLLADHGLETGDTIYYSAGGGAPIGNLEDGQIYFVIVDDNNPNLVRLADSRVDALNGNFITLGTGDASGDQHRLALKASTFANAARAENKGATSGVTSNAVKSSGKTPTTFSGTVAQISGAEIETKNVDIDAKHDIDLVARAGGFGIGLAGGVGVGVEIVNVNADVSAFVDTGSTIKGLDSTNGRLSIDAELGNRYSLLGIAGSAGGYFAVGGAVAVLNDTSDVAAIFGEAPDGTGDTNASRATGFGDMDVEALTSNITAASVGAAAISPMGFAGAVSWMELNANGSTKAGVGDNAVIGANSNRADAVGSLNIIADSSVTMKRLDDNAPQIITLSGGVAGFAGGFGFETDNTKTTTFIGSGTDIAVTDDIIVSSVSSSNLDMRVDGGAIGILAVGVMIGTAKVAGSTSAEIRSGANGARIRGGSLTVLADATASATVNSIVAGGGLLTAGANITTAEVDREVLALLGENADIAISDGNVTANDIKVIAVSDMGAQTDTLGVQVAALAVGVSKSNSTVSPTVSAKTGANVTLTADGAINIAAAHNDEASIKQLRSVAGQASAQRPVFAAGAEAEAEPSGGGLVGISAGEANATASANVSANIGDGSNLSGNTAIDVRAVSVNKARAKADTVTVGAIGVGVTEGNAEANGETKAFAASSAANPTTLNSASGSIKFQTAGSNEAVANTTAAGGGIVSGRGTEANAKANPTNKAYIGNNAIVSAGGNLTVDAQEAAEADANAGSFGGGGIDVGEAVATSTIGGSDANSVGDGSQSVEAYVGSGATLAIAHNVVVSSKFGATGAAFDDVIASGDVDTAQDTLTIPNVGLATGFSVLYQNSGTGSDIAGLEDKREYNVVSVSGDQFRLGNQFKGASVNAQTDTIEFDNEHRFKDGDQVVYRASNGADLPGLDDGKTYEVVVVDERSIKLIDPAAPPATPKSFEASSALQSDGKTFTINGHGFTQGQAVTYEVPDAVSFSPILSDISVSATGNLLLDSNNEAVIDPDINNFFVTRHQFSNGDDVIYSEPKPLEIDANAVNGNTFNVRDHGLSDGLEVRFTSGNLPGGLSLNQSYFVIVQSSDAFQLAASAADAANGTQIPLTSGGSGALSLELVRGAAIKIDGDVDRTFDPSAVNDGADRITIDNHGLLNGERIIYSFGGGQNDAGPGVGSSAGLSYFVIVVDKNTIQLANSLQNARSFAAIDLNDQASGTQRIRLADPANRTLVDGETYIVEKESDNSFKLVSRSVLGGLPPIAINAAGIEGFHSLARPWQVPIIGLVDGQTYYVTNINGDDFQLARTVTDAQIGNAITALDASGITGAFQSLGTTGVDLSAGSDLQAIHELAIDLTAQPASNTAHRILAPGGISLNLVVPSTGDGVSTARAEGASGKFVGADINKGSAKFNIDALARLDAAQLVSGGNVKISSEILSNHATTGDNGTGGGVAVGKTEADSDVNIKNIAQIGVGSTIEADGDFTLLSSTDGTTYANADSEGGGGIAIFDAQADTDVKHETAANIKDNAKIIVGGLAHVRSASKFKLEVRADADGGGAAADGLANDANGNKGASLKDSKTTAKIDEGAQIEAQLVDVTAEVTSLDLKAVADSRTGGVAADADAYASVDINSNAEVDVNRNARITGFEGVDITAKHGTTTTYAEADTLVAGLPNVFKLFIGKLPDSDAKANINTNLNNRVDGIKDALITAGTGPNRDGYALRVIADEGILTQFADGHARAIIPDGDETINTTSNENIFWDSDVVVGLGQNTILEIDKTGTIVEAQNVTVLDETGKLYVDKGFIIDSTIDAGVDIIVDDISPSGAGKILFDGTDSVRNAADTTQGTGNVSIGTFSFSDTMGGVRIENSSTHDLTIHNIDVFDGAETPIVDTLTNSLSMDFLIRRDVIATDIDILNLLDGTAPGSADIVLTGTITNPIGRTNILNERGDILSSAARGVFTTLPPGTMSRTQLIETNSLNINATANGASIGDITRRINIDLVEIEPLVDPVTGLTTGDGSSKLTAGAEEDIYLDLKGIFRRVDNSIDTEINIDKIDAGRDVDLRLQTGEAQDPVRNAGGGVRVTQNMGTLGIFQNKFRPDMAPGTPSVSNPNAGLLGENAVSTAMIYNFDRQDQNGVLTNQPGLIAGRNITVTTADTSNDPDKSIEIKGFTNLTGSLGNIEVLTNGPVTLTESTGDMRIARIQSTTSDVTLTATDGNIIEAPENSDPAIAGPDADADVLGRNVTLTALQGGIGQFIDTDNDMRPDTTIFLEIDSNNPTIGAVAATARDQILLDEVEGDLRVDQIVSNSAGVALIADGSIIDANGDNRANITSINVDLHSETGSIGEAGDDLEINSSFNNTTPGFEAGRVNVLADQNIYLTETDPNGADNTNRTLNALNIEARNGEAIITVPERLNRPTSTSEDFNLLNQGDTIFEEGTIQPVSQGFVKAGRSIELRIADDVSAATSTLIAAGTNVIIRGDYDERFANFQNDEGFGTNMVFGGTIASGTAATAVKSAATDAIDIFGNLDTDIFTFNSTVLQGQTNVYGSRAETPDTNGVRGQAPFADDGRDYFNVNQLSSILSTSQLFDPNTNRTVTRVDTLRLDGQADGDFYNIVTDGSGAANTSDYVISVLDTGAYDDGSDLLDVEGSNIDDDIFLLRGARYLTGESANGPSYVALLYGSLDQAQTPSGDSAVRPQEVARINYDQNINGRLTVLGKGGNDYFATDDTSAIITLDGGEGADNFQIGQLYGFDREGASGLPEADQFGTALTTRGHLSDGVSFPLLAQGGAGDDVFTVYSNKAEIRLEGDAGSDEFIVRAFKLENTKTFGNQGQTNIKGGSGADQVQYNINAPVSIDGGDGFDRVVAIGTEDNDSFVITKDGIIGAGLNIKLAGNEELREVDGAAGDDNFFVLSTPANALTRIIGGLGSDTINVGSDVTEDIISREVEGLSSGIAHKVTTTNPNSDYNGLLVDGIDLNVASDKEGVVRITQLADPILGAAPVEDGNTRVNEAGQTTDMFAVSLADRPLGSTPIYVNLSAARSSETERRQGGDTILIAITTNPNAAPNNLDFVPISKINGVDTDTPSRDATLKFDTTNNFDEVYYVHVRAVDDGLSEGERVVTVSFSTSHEADPSLSNMDQAADLAKFDEADVANLEVTVLDNDRPELKITESDGDTLVLEGAVSSADRLTDSYQLELTAKPEAGERVTVTLDFDASELSLTSIDTRFNNSGGVFTVQFDETNWDRPVEILVSGEDNNMPEDRKTSAITHTVSAVNNTGSARFDDARSVRVSVDVVDDDRAGVLVRESAGSTLVTQNGAGDNYRLRLTKPPAPGEIVSINLLTDGQTTIDLTNPAISLQNVGEAGNGLFANGAVEFFAATEPKIARTDGTSWLADGFAAGQLIRISGTGGANDSLVVKIQGFEADGAGNANSVMLLTGDTNITVVGGISNNVTLTRVAATASFDASNYATDITVGVAADPFFKKPDAQQNVRTFTPKEHLLTKIEGPLQIIGDKVTDRDLRKAVILPAELNGDLFDVPIAENPLTDIDFLNIYDDSSKEDKVGRLTSENLSGLGMGTGFRFADFVAGVTPADIIFGISMNEDISGGITYGFAPANDPTGNAKTDIEVFNLMLGEGDDHITVTGTMDNAVRNGNNFVDTPNKKLHDGLTVLHGGGNSFDVATGVRGGDTFIVEGGAGPDSPLVIYGDTSQDGTWYNGVPSENSKARFGDATQNLVFDFPLANPFNNYGDDIVDASKLFDGIAPGNLPTIGLSIYGGRGADDLTGSQAGDHIAGGGAEAGSRDFDRILGEGGPDHIYGDSGINVDIVTRSLFITNRSSSTAPNSDPLLLEPDMIEGGDGNDIIFGDYGNIIQSNTPDPTDPNFDYLNISPTDPQLKIISTEPTTVCFIETVNLDRPGGQDGADIIEGNAGDDIIFGGIGKVSNGVALGDTIYGESAGAKETGDDVIFGDFGEVTVQNGKAQLGRVQTQATPFGDRDLIFGNKGDDWILGGQDDDQISGNEGDDIIFGDYGQIIGNDQTSDARRYRSLDPQFGGRDLIFGNEGNDQIVSGTDDDQAHGNQGDDLIFGDHAFATLTGDFRPLIARTIFDERGGKDELFGEEDQDIIFGGADDDLIRGGDDDDRLLGDVGIAVHNPLNGNMRNRLTFLTTTTSPVGGNDRIFGDDGCDYVWGAQGDDFLRGGNGDDLVVGDSAQASMVPNREARRVSFTTIDPFNGGNDMLHGDAGSDIIVGGARGARGGDLLFGNNSEDLLFGDNVGLEIDQSQPCNFFQSVTRVTFLGGSPDQLIISSALNEAVGAHFFSGLGFEFDIGDGKGEQATRLTTNPIVLSGWKYLDPLDGKTGDFFDRAGAGDVLSTGEDFFFRYSAGHSATLHNMPESDHTNGGEDEPIGVAFSDGMEHSSDTPPKVKLPIMDQLGVASAAEEIKLSDFGSFAAVALPAIATIVPRRREARSTRAAGKWVFDPRSGQMKKAASPHAKLYRHDTGEFVDPNTELG